ncbi:hypothetical protein ACSVC9_08355 [Clostridium sp. LBM24168]
MDNKLAMCKIITNFKNFNMLINQFIEKIPPRIEAYKYVTIISSFIINNTLSFDIKYSCSDQEIINIFRNVFRNVINEMAEYPSKFVIELQSAC